MERLAAHVGIESALIDDVADRVARKLATEPIEDLRLDFEDGYGDRGDAEDTDVARAASKVSDAVASGSAPPFIGIRFKCFEKPTRARGLRTLDLFIGGLLDAGGLPDGLVLTLPKVTTTAQVEAMVIAVQALERAHGLDAGRLRFEVQVETPQLVLGADGRSPLAQLPVVAPGRISGLHYGTYDYSASLGIAAEYQSMEHPAADLAKEIMQLAVAGTGIRLSDGSTNILPVGEGAAEAWALHARLVRRSLERGYYQGWDLHPHQLATRYLATYAFYRHGYADAASRLRAYLAQEEGAVMDEPATARALAWFVLRGVQCGAIDPDEVAADIGIRVDALTALAHPRLSGHALARA
jgi:citrate lyase beta subunit